MAQPYLGEVNNMSILFSILITLSIVIILASAIYLLVTFIILKVQKKKEKQLEVSNK